MVSRDPVIAQRTRYLSCVVCVDRKILTLRWWAAWLFNCSADRGRVGAREKSENGKAWMCVCVSAVCLTTKAVCVCVCVCIG